LPFDPENGELQIYYSRYSLLSALFSTFHAAQFDISAQSSSKDIEEMIEDFAMAFGKKKEARIEFLPSLDFLSSFTMKSGNTH